MVPVILTMAVLYIWTSEGGSKPPSATDIAIFFDNKEEWMDALDKHWSRIGLGLPLSSQIRVAAAAFYVVCASRLASVSAAVVSENVSRALKPAEALKQARLRQLAWGRQRHSAARLDKSALGTTHRTARRRARTLRR